MTSRAKLLFVDDEPKFLAGIKRMLHKHQDKWEIEFADSVDEALDLLSQSEFDLIVSDMVMPGKNGFDLLRAVCGNDIQNCIPVVVLTGSGDVELKSKALELGASDLLNKPVIVQDLIARINTTLRIKAYQDDIKEYNRVLEQKVAERTKDLDISRIEILWRLAKAGEYRDEETGNHTARVGHFSRIMAEGLNMPDDFTNSLFLTSPLHDIGKIGIPDGILLKKDKLTPGEWEVMQTHCAIGVSILKEEVKGLKYYYKIKSDKLTPFSNESDKRNNLLDMAAVIALSHHERWDGRGYPQNLAKEEIPISARIVAVADVYDALVSERPYKPAFSSEKAFDIIIGEKEKHFDPDVVQVFKENFAEFKHISYELRDSSPAS